MISLWFKGLIVAIMTVDDSSFSDTGMKAECVTSPSLPRTYNGDTKIYSVEFCAYQAGLGTVIGDAAYDTHGMCRGEGMEMATVNSLDERELFNQLLLTTKVQPLWLGAEEDGVTDRFYWLTNGTMAMDRPVNMPNTLAGHRYKFDNEALGKKGVNEPYMMAFKNPEEWYDIANCKDVIELMTADPNTKDWGWRCNVACERIVEVSG